ncbi:MAG TPA: hypothetical protein VJB14_15465 [Planctomycetota bacterium]|nr:hypothetical protein [Planctomycetota bacterium]
MRFLCAIVLLLPGGLSNEEFRKLQPELRLKGKGWASLPWKATLTGAREAALKERKPIFMMVDTGNPIGFA